MNSKDIVKDLGERNFQGKIVKSVYFSAHSFLIKFTDDDYIEVETDDEPLEFDAICD
jgi:hypothetical protein